MICDARSAPSTAPVSTTDQRGSPRPGHGEAACDSGAYEFTVTPLAPAPQAATTAWAIGPNQAIQYDDATSTRWQNIDGNGSRIALGAAGQSYVVNGSSGAIFRRAKGANGYVDGSWQQLPGTATDIGAGADGSVWTIGTAANPGGDANGHAILYFDASTASFKPVDGSAMSIAVAPDGQSWVVNASGRIYRRTRGAAGYVDGAWQLVTGTARDIGVGSDGSVWTIGTNQLAGGYGIYRYDATSGTWQATSGAGVASQWMVKEHRGSSTTADRSGAIRPAAAGCQLAPQAAQRTLAANSCGELK